ncbi:MAG: hypothetical protein Q9220_007541 [cf. Caloplaca sp. 1 TL-2023]
MPGILPMKVIKLGTSAQSRIAQACDRCRSKKIRCDGITPCCSQCASVSFECRTSDKLSRRAFPRGYTESLEERVRSLEQEVRELKDLLDEKDEKIDILSRIRANSPPSRRPSSEISPKPPVVEEKPLVEHDEPKEETFKVQQSPDLLDGEADSYFMGASSGRAFVDTFIAKAKESSKQCPDVKTDAFFVSETANPSLVGSPSKPLTVKAPPRLVSDQMTNIFFQEWAPLFPVLHRPTFLNLYTHYVADPEAPKDQHSVAQLNLVFGIAALSTDWNQQSTESFEPQWRDAVEVIVAENTLATLQCLVLAQMYCIAKADYNKLLHYKGIAISLSHRLGLHQSQKRFSLDPLTTETRKRVFWSFFSAALLGLPRLLNETDVHTEYPTDVDDENISERGFQPTLPGESTRVSSALALFRGSRILAKVLDELYPASLSYNVSLRKLGELSDELDTWSNALPAHLRLDFVQDKPSTKITGSRSPFLSLTYQYIRTLIHRPAVGSSLGSQASSSVVALANASKHIIQIVQLLDERRMGFSLCLNKDELLILCGVALMYQGLDLNRKGKLMQDSQRLICSVIGILERNAAHGSAEFKTVACAMISIPRAPKVVQATKDGTQVRRKADANAAATQPKNKQGRKQLQAIASRFSTGNIRAVKAENNADRRATSPTFESKSVFLNSDHRNSVSSTISDPLQAQGSKQYAADFIPAASSTVDLPNLDYLSFGNDTNPTPTYPDVGGIPPFKEVNADEFTKLLGSPPLDVPFDNWFGPLDVHNQCITPSASMNHLDWGPGSWPVCADISNQATAQSNQSFTEEELTSGEELSIGDMNNEDRGTTMPHADGFGLEGFDLDFRP